MPLWSVIKFHLCLFPRTFAQNYNYTAQGNAPFGTDENSFCLITAEQFELNDSEFVNYFLYFKEVLTSEYNIRTNYNRSVKLKGKLTTN